MIYRQIRNIPKEVILFTLFSVILHQSGYLFLFFLLPMQVLCRRKGSMALFQGLTALVSIIFVISIVRTASAGTMGERAVIIVSETVAPLFLAGGLLYINMDWPGNPGNLKKILAATAAAYIAGIPFLLIFSSSMFMDFYRSQVSIAMDIVTMVAAESPGIEFSELAEIIAAMGADDILAVLMKTFMRVYMYTFFLIISVSFLAGNTAFKERKENSSLRLSELTLSEYMVWLLIGALSVVLIDYRINTGFIGYTGWNILLIMTTLYGLRGVGIIQGAMKARNIKKSMQAMIIAAIILLLLQPGLNYIVLIGLPALGVSEIWIKYNRIQE